MAGLYYQDILIDNNGQVRCELCDTTIRDNDYLIEEHLQNTEHVKLHRRRLLVCNGITISGNKTESPWPATVGKAECSLCDRIFDVRYILDHLGSVDHVKKITSIKEVVTKDGGFMVLPENITKFGCAVNCMICNAAVKLKMEDVKLHIATEKHKRYRSIAVQPLNGIFCLDDTDEYLWCKVCQKYFQNYVELILQHVDEDSKHLTEIRKLILLIKDQNISIEKFLQNPKENCANCRTCQTDIPCTIVNLDTHIRGKQHSPSLTIN